MAMYEEQERPDTERPPKRRRPLGAGIPPTGHRRADEWAAEEHATALREDRGCWHCWGIAQGISAARKGSVAASFPTAEERDGSPLPEGYVWLGALSGWEVGIMSRHSHDGGLAVCLYHRCGWAEPIAPCGIAEDHSVYLGNLVERAREVAEEHTCAPHEPSEEHKARVAEWTKQADDLASTERVSGSPVQRPGRLLYADAPGLITPQHRPVDGPGCTPALVPGVLRSVHAFNSGSSGANVECLGEQCTGCSDSQCWTVRADGGDV